MTKGLAFLYGVVAYLTFLLAFLYATGFTGNVLVRRASTTGPSGQSVRPS